MEKQTMQYFERKVASSAASEEKYTRRSGAKIMAQLFREYQNAKLPQQKHKLEIQKREHFIARGRSYEWIPSSIREYIENTMDVTYTWSVSVGGRDITINIILPSSTAAAAPPDAEFRQIYRWFSMAAKYACPKCSQKLAIYLYFTDLKKQLPKKTQILSPENVNTAYTTSCAPSCEIHLFRREEWFKVLIHESFHCLGLDFSDATFPAAKERIRAAFPGAAKGADLLIYETYTECMAEILVALFSSTTSKGAAAAIKREQIFSVFQSCKILDFMDMRYEDLTSAREAGAYREKTPVFSYYILKSILMVHINEFFDWCAENNKNALRFDAAKIGAFVDFIVERRDSDKYRAYVAVIEPYFTGGIPRHRSVDERTNLRMTYLEAAFG